MMRLLWLIVAVFTILVVGAFALSGYVASEVSAQIRHQVGGDRPDALEVAVRADPLLLLTGRIARVEVRSGPGKMMVAGLTVEVFEAEMHNLALDLRALLTRQDLYVLGAGSGQARIIVHQDDLRAYVRKQRNVDLALTLLDGKATVHAPLLGGVVEAQGRFVPAGARVNVELHTLQFSGLRLESPALTGLAAGINPVLDLSVLPVPVTLTEVRAEDHRLVALARIP
jgi:hypothetical protein